MLRSPNRSSGGRIFSVACIDVTSAAVHPAAIHAPYIWLSPGILLIFRIQVLLVSNNTILVYRYEFQSNFELAIRGPQSTRERGQQTQHTQSNKNATTPLILLLEPLDHMTDAVLTALSIEGPCFREAKTPSATRSTCMAAS